MGSHYSITVTGHLPPLVTRRQVACHRCGECKWSRGPQRVTAIWTEPGTPVDHVYGRDDGGFEWVCESCGTVANRETVLLLDHFCSVHPQRPGQQASTRPRAAGGARRAG